MAAPIAAKLVGDAAAQVADIGGSVSRPFVIVASGQSNMQGRSVSGDKTNPANTFTLNGWMGATTLVQAKFGSAPFNLTANGAGTTTDPALSCNNIAMQFANALRANGSIPSERPIVIVPNAIGGQPLSQWIGNGASSSYFQSLVTSLNAVATAYPGFKIDVMLWAQGEGDANSFATPYSSKAGYISGFKTLLSQLRGLPQWSASTAVSMQELGDWYAASQRDRNDAIRTFRNGSQDPYVTTVSSSNMAEAVDSPLYHYEGTALVQLGRAHFDAWNERRLNGTYSSRSALDRSSGGADIVKKNIELAANATYNLSADDVRGGGCSIRITGTGVTINLPAVAAWTSRVDIDVFANGFNFVLSATGGNIVSDFGVSGNPKTIPGLTVAKVYNAPGVNNWIVEGVSPRVANTLRQVNDVTGAYTPDNLRFYFFLLTTTTFTLPQSGISAGSDFVCVGKSGTSTITPGSVPIKAPGGATLSSVTVLEGEVVHFHYSNSVYYLIRGNPRGSQESTPASGATVTAKAGLQAQTIHLLHGATIAALTVALPANPADDQSVTLVATSAVTALTYSGGTTGALAPSSLAAGQVATLRYSAASSTWR